MREKRLDLLAVVLAAVATALLSLKAPGLGDDFQYWYTAWNLHEYGAEAWNRQFHTLRWPVWGMCWLLQGIFGPGLLSFYGVPIFYLSLGSILAYMIGWRVFDSRRAAWSAVVLYLFHPLLNSVIYRPMPDLSEGTFIALAVYLWLRLTEQEKTSRRALLAVAIGLVTGLNFSNRITGVFVFGVLGAVALAGCWRNERFPLRRAIPWLACIGVVWVVYFCLEGLVYYRLGGDFLHSIHSNLGAKGRKGTEGVNVFLLPFRFFGPLWKQSALSPLLTVLALFGIWPLWRRGGTPGRMVVAWGIALYLLYNCSLQSINPPRPLLRDADRFLASLSLPLALLMTGGLRWVLGLMETHPALERLRPVPAWLQRYPVVVGMAGAAVLYLASERPFTNFGFIPHFRAYLAELPSGTRIFTHPILRDFAFITSPGDARRLEWVISQNILPYSEENEAKAQGSDQFWYCRKKAWISIRKNLEKEGPPPKPVKLASYFEDPASRWVLKDVINVGGVPEFAFYEKRKGDNPPRPVPLKALLPDTPDLPLTWERPGKKLKPYKFKLTVPETVRGRLLQLRVKGSANYVQAVRSVQLTFKKGGRKLESVEFRPYLYPTPSLDFQTLAVPAEAESCEVRIVMHQKGKKVKIDAVEAIMEPAGNRAEHTLPVPLSMNAGNAPSAPLAAL